MWQCEYMLCMPQIGSFFWWVLKAVCFSVEICTVKMARRLFLCVLMLFFRLQARLFLGNHKYVSFFTPFSIFHCFILYKDRDISLIMKAWGFFFFPDFLLTQIVFVFCFPTLLEDGSKIINGFGPATSLKDWERRKNISSFTTEA